jgi:small subunit ribosomal protein S2
MPYVINRWLGGTLTNWQTIQTRINYMLRLERMEFAGDFETMPKKEALRRRKELNRLHRYLGGVRDMAGLPGALFLIDVPKENIAVLEASRLDIPIIAICDSNCDPTPVEYPIPSNDDAFRALSMITTQIADAALAGRTAVESARADQAAAAAEAAAEAAEPVPAGAE